MRIGTLFGIPIHVHWSWLLGFVFITWTVATGNLPFISTELTEAQRWAIAALISISLFASVMVHELAHSLTAKRLGYRVLGITLLIFGGVSLIAENRSRASHDFMIAFAGPLASLIIGIASIALMLIFTDGATTSRSAFNAGIFRGWLQYLGFMNLILAAFNMLPGIPLDGGRVLQSVVWGITGNRTVGARVAVAAGRIIATLMIMYGLYQALIADNWFSGAWMIMLGLFIASASSSEARSIDRNRPGHDISVRAAMTPAHTVLDNRTPLDAALRNVLQPNPRGIIPVISNGRVSGFISLRAVEALKLHPEEPSRLSVGDAEMTISTCPISDQARISRAIQLLEKRNLERLLVFDGARLIGTIGRDEISSAIDETRTDDLIAQSRDLN